MFSRRLDNAQSAIEAVLARAASEAGEVRWALEMTSGAAGLLITVLHAARQPVTYVPGRLVNRMSGAFAGEGKTDAKDARTIAETARLRTDLTVIAPAEQLVVELHRAADALSMSCRRPSLAKVTVSSRLYAPRRAGWHSSNLLRKRILIRHSLITKQPDPAGYYGDPSTATLRLPSRAERPTTHGPGVG